MSPAAENPDDRSDRPSGSGHSADGADPTDDDGPTDGDNPIDDADPTDDDDLADDADPTDDEFVPDPTPESPAPDPPRSPAVREFDDIAEFDVVTDRDGIRDLDTSRVDDETLRAFVACVVYANAALLLVSLGPMLWFFRGEARLGGALFVGGVLAGIRTYQTYRAWDRSRDGDEAAESRPSPER